MNPGRGNPKTAVTNALPWATGALVALAVGSTFAPWFRTGETSRSSYETVQAAVRLDLLDPTLGTVARSVWSFVPLLGCLAILALILERTRLGSLLGVIVGVVPVVLAAVVSRAPDRVEWGVTAAIVSGLALVVVSVLLLTTPAPKGSHGQHRS